MPAPGRDAPALPGAGVAAAEAALARREAALADTRWRLTGRVALSNGRDGGSGRLEWEGDVAARDYVVALSAPVTRQSWRLRADASGAVLDGLDSGPREGIDADLVLREATGWEVPVRALSAWMVGARAPASFGPAEVGFDADARLVTLVQDGWTVRYSDWRPGPEPVAGVEAMPGRVEATRGDARVRLVVDDWSPVPRGAGGDD